MVQLRVCEQCERHVRVGESVCPFCQNDLAEMPLDLRRKISGHLSRAQRFAAAMSVAAAPLAGCSETMTGPMDPTGNDTGGVATSTGGAQSAGGVQGAGGVQATGGALATGGAQTTGGMIVFPPYGIPPLTGGEMPQPLYGAVFLTGGTELDAGAKDADVPDGGDDAGPVILPAYGLPPGT